MMLSKATASLGESFDEYPLFMCVWWQHPKLWLFFLRSRWPFFWNRIILRRKWYGHYKLVKIEEWKDFNADYDFRFLHENSSVRGTFEEIGP